MVKHTARRDNGKASKEAAWCYQLTLEVTAVNPDDEMDMRVSCDYYYLPVPSWPDLLALLGRLARRDETGYFAGLADRLRQVGPDLGDQGYEACKPVTLPFRLPPEEDSPSEEETPPEGA
jgi:hypothetical protein